MLNFQFFFFNMYFKQFRLSHQPMGLALIERVTV